jgi:hypothetical protein
MTDLDEVVRIRGEVDEGTFEYSKGARFFDSNCTLYSHRGRRVTVMGAMVSAGSIIREAATAEILTYTLPSKVRVNVNKRITRGSAIPSDWIQFRLTPGSIYFNRFGYPVILQWMSGMVGGSEHFTYEPDGRCLKNIPTMNDLVAMSLDK